MSASRRMNSCNRAISMESSITRQGTMDPIWKIFGWQLSVGFKLLNNRPKLSSQKTLTFLITIDEACSAILSRRSIFKRFKQAPH